MRSDSAEEVVRDRLAVYHEKTEPLVAFYQGQGLLEHVDASASPEDVERATIELLERLGGERQEPGQAAPGSDV